MALAWGTQAWGSDRYGGAVYAFPAGVSESAQRAESVSSARVLRPSLSENQQRADSTGTGLTAKAAVAETASRGETAGSVPALSSSVAETAQRADAVGSVLIVPIPVSAAEGATYVDAVARGLIVPREAGETALFDDATESGGVFTPATSDAVTAGEDTAALLVRGTSVTEGAARSDALTTVHVFGVFAEEEATNTVLALPQRETFAVMAEQASLSTRIAAKKQWDDSPFADDGGASNWQNVPGAATGPWTPVDDSQATGWTPAKP